MLPLLEFEFESVQAFDPLKLSVNVRGLGLSGYEAAEALERDHGVVPELATSAVGCGRLTRRGGNRKGRLC